MTELVYKSTWCQAIPSIYISNVDEDVERLIGKVFAKKVDRLVFKNGKYYYSPSEEYCEHFASMRKIK